MRECAERDDEPVSSALSGDENDNETVEWMRAVLAKLDDDNTRGSAGGDDDDDDDDDDDEEVCRGKCLGRRMECFESVEAEGREMWGRYVGVSRAEGQEVPTRVLFDYRRIPAAVEVGEGEGESESGDGGVKGGGEGERETEMERGISSGR